MYAQDMQIKRLAEQMADSFSRLEQKDVVVFEFHGLDEMDALGQRLAAEFNAALTESARDFHVVDPCWLVHALQKYDLTPANIFSAGTASWPPQQTKVDTLILGTMSTGIGGLRISVEAYQSGIGHAGRVFRHLAGCELIGGPVTSRNPRKQLHGYSNRHSDM